MARHAPGSHFYAKERLLTVAGFAMGPDRDQPDSHKEGKERKRGEALSSPSGRVVYEAILAEAKDELQRGSGSLFWSGLAAGSSMGFSLISEAVLRAHLPDAGWTPLVAKLGYAVGFLIVILGRQQLFTENTLTPVLELLRNKEPGCALNVLRLWTVVLAANLLGGLVVAWVVAGTGLLAASVQEQVSVVGQKALEPSFGLVLLRGIFAGWLIALMIWLLPFAEASRVWVIIIIAWLVGVAHLSHVVAGSIYVSALAFDGGASWIQVGLGYVLPSLIGNVIGGVVLVAAINHAQVTSDAQVDL